MKILNAKQMRAADQYSIENEPITSIDLMERAGAKCFDWFRRTYSKEFEYYIFCGMGNNGGDGLVIARLLVKMGIQVNCYAVRFTQRATPEFNANASRYKALGKDVFFIDSKSDIPRFSGAKTVIIDAIFGAGLSRDVEGFTVDLIQAINDAEGNVVSIDMPSGLYVQGNDSHEDRSIVQADFTLSLQSPKLSQLLPVNEKYVGQLVIVPIGLDEEFISQLQTNHHYLTMDVVKGLVMPRNRFSHKGTFGHALIIAGSKGKIGAAVLSTLACLRTGAGLVTTHIPKCGYSILQSTAPEAMVEEDEGMDYILGHAAIDNKTIGIGPGLGLKEETSQFLHALILKCNRPMVFDADALNIIAQNPSWMKNIPKDSIFTPHPKEFERLVGVKTVGEKRLLELVKFASKHQVYVVLKGANTGIGCPDGQIYFNATGNPGMATGGSGDVLTGIITALLAQGYTSKDCCRLGVYAHGLAGDKAKEILGENAMIASDLVNNLGFAFKTIMNKA